MTPDELKNFFNALKNNGILPTMPKVTFKEFVYGIPPLTPLYKNFLTASNCPALVEAPKDTPRTEINDLGAKLAAQILLADSLSGIVIPSTEEWIGLNLLERDDELRRKEHAPPKQQTQIDDKENKSRIKSDSLPSSQKEVDKL